MYTIFGSTGFIGKELAQKLKKNGKKIFLPSKNKFKFNKNLGIVIYCVGSDDWLNEVEKGFFSNLGHLQKIIFNNKFKLLIFLSTTRVYVNSKNTLETSKLLIDPNLANDYYNILKIASESLIFNSRKKFKILRLSNVFGYNSNSPLLLPTLIRNALKKRKIKITISLNSTKDYIHIDDVLRVIMKINTNSKFDIYNLASGKNIKIRNIVNIIKKVTKCKVFLKNQKLIIKEPKINIRRLETEFNFKSSLNLKKDLPALIKKFKK